ncbi:family 10 glycosylhydrolase [Pirellulales bacterium]|nr:family 10 glycosylhydrolase [Pirellulales bacterium]
MKRELWITLAMTASSFSGVSVLAESGPALQTSPSPMGKPMLGIYGGAGNESYRQAVDLGFTYIFPAVHWYADHSWIKGKVQQAHADGLKVCPSYGTAGDGYGDDHTEFFKQHPEWREVRQDGSKTDKGAHVGLSFGVSEVRKHKIDTFIKYIREYDLDGILLDYTRMFDRTCGYHPSIVEAFKAKTGRDPREFANSDPQWVRFRAEIVTTFVRELRKEADALGAERGRPVELLACVDPDPNERLFSVLQDWQTWVEEGLIQGVVTMVYHHDPNETIEKVRVANEVCRGKVWHMPMIAPYHYYLTTEELLIDASLKCLKTGTGALAFYRDDYISKYDLWDAIAEVASWTDDDVAQMKVNYVRNPGFELAMENWADGGNTRIERVEQAELARTGNTAVRFSGPGGLRQIIERGLPSNMNSLTVSCWIKAETPPGDGQLFIDVCTNAGRGKESNFRVPVTLKQASDWQRVEARLPLDASRPLNLLMIGIVSESASDNFYVDDFAASLGEESVKPTNDYAISPRRASANWNPASDNLLRGQAVTGSSYWEAGTECDNAVDGDLSREQYGYGAVWVSQRPAEDQWILISLPAAKTINGIRVLNNASQSAYRTREYHVEVSADGRAFRTVAEGTLPDEGDTWTESTFKKTKAKYIRFNGISGYNREYAVGIQEIEAYGPGKR